MLFNPTASQVTFLNAAAMPKEVRLLHAPTLASAFRQLPGQLVISPRVARQQLQHSISVNSNIAVHRFLKVEMTGLAVEQATGMVGNC